MIENRAFQRFIVIVTVLAARGQVPIISVSPNPVQIGVGLTALCTVPINNMITFLVDNIDVGNCPPPFLAQPCTSSDIEQNSTTGETRWTLKANVSYEGSWTCSRFTTPSSNNVPLSMYKCADSTFTENGISSNLELNETSTVDINFETGCIYPPSNPKIVLQFKAGPNVLSSNINCVATGTTCDVGSAYECSHNVFFNMQLTDNGKFDFGTNYTLLFKASPSIGDCESVAIFDQYSLTFISTGTSLPPPTTITTEGTTLHVFTDCLFGERVPKNGCYMAYGALVVVVVFIGVIIIVYVLRHSSTTGEHLTTEQSPTSFTYSTYASTKDLAKETTETLPIISTDLYITTYDSTTVSKGQNLLIYIVIPVSVGIVCLVVLAGVIICYVNYTHQANEKKASGIYTDPETTSHEEHVYQRRSTGNPEHGQNTNTEKSPLQWSLNHNERSHELFHCHHIDTRRNLQHDRYEKNFYNDERVGRRLHPIEMAYLPFGHYRNEHYVFGQQASRSAVSNDTFYDYQRRKMIHQRDHNSFSNFGFYRV